MKPGIHAPIGFTFSAVSLVVVFLLLVACTAAQAEDSDSDADAVLLLSTGNGDACFSRNLDILLCEESSKDGLTEVRLSSLSVGPDPVSRLFDKLSNMSDLRIYVNQQGEFSSIVDDDICVNDIISSARQHSILRRFVEEPDNVKLVPLFSSDVNGDGVFEFWLLYETMYHQIGVMTVILDGGNLDIVADSCPGCGD